VDHSDEQPAAEPGLQTASRAFHLARELLSLGSVEGAASLLTRRISEALGTPAAVYLLGRNDALVLTDATEGIHCRDALALAKEALASGSVATAPVAPATESGSRSSARRAAVVIKTPTAVFGVLVVEGVRDADQLRYLLALAALVASSFRRGEQVQASAAEARLDPLTGLPNKRAFLERLTARMQGPHATNTLSVVLFDLDNFKQINDREGHLVGDRVLRDVARVAISTLRAGEEAFRLGGEEFAVLVSTGSEDAVRVADRVRQALAARRSRRGLPSISAGVATFPGDALTREELIHKADVALYVAKERGKDQVVSYTAGLAEETASLDEDRQLQLEGEWWLKVLGAASRGLAWDEEVGPGWSPHDLARLAESVARELALRDDEVDTIVLGAVLVELSKLGIPDAIKHKSGRLNEREWDLVRGRTERIVSVLSPIPHLAEALPILRSCRERWDGAGHPDGLAGEAIPVGARVVAVCDAFCALQRKRSYRPARSQTRALLELEELAGTRFDPACVLALRTAVGSAPVPLGAEREQVAELAS
jgi:diguanylate cyclase (GGDEF)-like protein